MAIRPTFYVLAIQAGFAIMAVEMTTARALAPFFGTSAFVWAVVIAVVMAAIFLGNLRGGKAADKGMGLQALCHRQLAACALVGVTSQITTMALDVGFERLPYNIALIGAAGVLSIVSFSMPVFLFALTCPWLIGLLSDEQQKAGGVSGRIYGASTAGGLLGTFAPVLFGVPLIGIRFTFAATSLLVALGAAAVLWSMRRRKGAFYGLLTVLLTLPLYLIPLPKPSSTVFQTESMYNSIWVDEDERVVDLSVNERKAIQSRSYKDKSVLPADVWGMYLTAPFFCTQREQYRILFLGLGAGSAATYYHRYYPKADLTGVEIDSKIIDAGRRFFGLNEIPMRIANEDARIYINHATEQWDVIIVDAFVFPYLPAHLSTVEFMAQLNSHLRPGGVVLMNVGHFKEFDDIVDSIAATGGTAFQHVYLYRVPNRMNTLVFFDESFARRQTKNRTFAHRGIAVARRSNRAKTRTGQRRSSSRIHG